MQQPGAWAGVNVCVKEDRGVVVLTSQEKWDRMKAICEHWRVTLGKGDTDLDFKRLWICRTRQLNDTLACSSLSGHGSLLSWETARYYSPKSGSARVMGLSAARRTLQDFGYPNTQAMGRSTFGPPLRSSQMLH